MANLNRIILLGRLTTEPEVRSTTDGRPMAKLKLSVARPFGGVDLIAVVAWQKEAEICRDQLKKGQMVLVEGRIQVRSFNDQAGQRRWVTEVVARVVQAMDGDKALPVSQSAAVSAPSLEDKAEENVEDFDLASDLPF